MPHKSRYSKTMYQFAKRIERLDPAIRGMANGYKKAIANRVHERLVMATPVDTSQALSNWQIATVSTGPVNSPIPAFFVGQGGSTLVASVGATLVAAVAPLKAVLPGHPVVVSNVVDYIEQLAYHPYKSSQAEYDWVGRALAQGARQGALEASTKVVW